MTRWREERRALLPRSHRSVATYPEPRLLPCGDLAVSVELGDEISREVNARVLTLGYLIQQKAVLGVTARRWRRGS